MKKKRDLTFLTHNISGIGGVPNEQNQKNMHKQIYTQKWIDSHKDYLANSYRTLKYKRVLT